MQINAVGSSRSKELKSSIIMKSKELEEKARDHIEELRKNKFSIGCQHPNPLTHDLHHAVTCLSAELYTKHVHFLMELIQNAEDNQYGVGVEPTLEFALTTNDITRCGAQETLLVFNNEIGFSRKTWNLFVVWVDPLKRE